MNEAELKRRTKQFALRVMKLVSALPNSVVGRALGGQLFRAGSSVGSNYRAACRGRSKAEFIAKLGTVVEEADESAYWMELIMEGGLLPKNRVESLHREAEEITLIMVSSRKTAGGLGRGVVVQPKGVFQARAGDGRLDKSLLRR